jgi:hypothetical protein
MKIKINIATPLILFMFILLLVASCNRTHAIETNTALEKELEPVVFYTLPVDSILDARIPESTIVVIYKHFAAMENGDLETFRSTLIAQDGVDLNHHMELIVHYFGDIIGIDIATFSLAMAGLADMGSMHRRIFDDEYSLRSRGTDLTIKKITLAGYLVRVILTDNKSEELTYYLAVGLCPHEENFISRHVILP